MNTIAAGSGVGGSMGTHAHSSGVGVLRHDQSEYVCGQRTFTEVGVLWGVSQAVEWAEVCCEVGCGVATA